MRLRCTFLFLLTTATAALAAPSDDAELTGALPNALQVSDALETHPMVEAAHGRLNAAEADARALAHGPHEIAVSTVASLRDVRADRQYGEFDMTVSRAFRLPGGARLDRQAGQYGIAAARNIAEDVQHQVALVLNQLWWDHLLALSLAEVDRATLGNIDAARTAVARQVALREASLLDLDLATAASGSARAQLATSEGQVRETAARFTAQFPGIALPTATIDLPVPTLSDSVVATMAAQVIDRSHEIGAAEQERLRRETLASRARLNRIPDPSFGVRLFRERSGEERGAGLVFSMPIGGGARRATADRAAAEASAALSDRMAVARDVAARSASDAAIVRGALAAWEGRRSALDSYVAATARSRRGYSLGGTDLAELLLAERQSSDAFRSAIEARVAALHAICQLMIDSHNLWIGGDEVHDDH